MNEVWFVCVGGVMFVVFLYWYVILFSGFYILFVFMFFVLILRGVFFKFCVKIDNYKWKSVWDWGMFIGSMLFFIFWGVVIVNFMVGVFIDESKNVVGGFL